MQILRLLAARRAASTITASATSVGRRDGGEDDDEGPFFDLDFSSLRASSSSSGSLSLSDSDSDESCEELDFIISLQRNRSASPLCFSAAPPLKFCASEPPARANGFQSQQQIGARKRGAIGSFRTLSFGARKAAPLNHGGRASFARSSSGRNSFARSSFSSTRSFRHLMDSPHAPEDEEHHAAEPGRRASSRDVIRRCLSKISRRLRTAKASPRTVEARGLRRLRKCRSASSAAPRPSSATAHHDDSAVEKQDGIAGAIAHCKESLHRASTSERDSPLLRSRSDPGKCEAAA